MLPYQSHVPHAPSRLNPSFPTSSFQIPSPLPSTNGSVPQPFPSPPVITGGGRFRKRKLSIAHGQGHGRGTMSMPTSPLGQSINAEVWQGPHSASPYSSQHAENAHVQPAQIPSFFSDQTISPPDPEYDTYAHHDHDHDHEGQDGEDVPPPRKKRAQVRVACTHCQKACKKCSNTRPCERCGKYGLPNCIDSTRKPRKTGVKRGPYKRRISSLYQEQYPLQPQQNHQAQQNQTYFNRSHLNQHQPLPDPITQAFAAAFDKPTWINGRRQSINQVQQHSFQPPYGHAAAPPPNPLQNTLIPNPSNSLPCLQNQGQRQIIPSISTTHIQTNITEARRGSMSSIFPISLHTFAGQDPFSRTVSPIGYRFSLPLPSTDIPNITGMNIDRLPSTTDVEMEGINNDYSMSSDTPPEINVVDFAYFDPMNQDRTQRDQNQVQGDGQGMVYHSAPTSPRGTRLDPDMGVGRASSAEPSTSFTPLNPFLNQDHNHSGSPGMGLGMGGMGMMTPIPIPTLGDRKPSLLTLMNTPLAQPTQTSFQESPTLFDGLPPISSHYQLESTDRERRLSYFGSVQMSSLPNAGGVGRLSLSKGSEGLGLGLGLEHVS